MDACEVCGDTHGPSDYLHELAVACETCGDTHGPSDHWPIDTREERVSTLLDLLRVPDRTLAQEVEIRLLGTEIARETNGAITLTVGGRRME
jgi:hypothetical protein